MSLAYLVVGAALLLVALTLLTLVQLRSSREVSALRRALDESSRQARVEAEHGLKDREATASAMRGLEVRLENRLGEVQQRLAVEGSEARERLLQRLHDGLQSLRSELVTTLDRGASQVDARVCQLVETTGQRLKGISSRVEERLAEGFERTNETFTKVMQQLARMDEAQKRLQELSTHVVSLQDVLNDKRSLGAFGEVQLEGLVENLLPANAYAFQHTLPNGKRPDCALLLPEPTGTLCIDAKFPLGDFQTFTNPDRPADEREAARKRFPIAVRGHIDAIADKYIVPGTTWPGAFMFIPSEAVFSEIHARHPELVEAARARRVFLTSPNTLMAICTTVATVLKDKATRDQVHIIQESLGQLGAHFDRFHENLGSLSKNIRIASEKATKAEREADQIRSRFRQIERVELEDGEPLRLGRGA